MDDYSIARDLAQCSDCPLLGRPYVAGEGNVERGIFVVGEAPGPCEEECGRPFVGPSGQLVRNVMSANDLDDVYFTNVMKRRPLSYKGHNRAPTKKECYECGSHLVAEIIRHRPKFVCALGNTATKFFTIREERKVREHGTARTVEIGNVTFTLVTTYNPSFVLRSGGIFSKAADCWVADLEEFFKYIRWEEENE